MYSTLAKECIDDRVERQSNNTYIYMYHTGAGQWMPSLENWDCMYISKGNVYGKALCQLRGPLSSGIVWAKSKSYCVCK